LQVRVLSGHHIDDPPVFVLIRHRSPKPTEIPIFQAYLAAVAFADVRAPFGDIPGFCWYNLLVVYRSQNRDTNMPLNDTKCRNAKGQIKSRKLSVGAACTC
jgi:hypothetical protein